MELKIENTGLVIQITDEQLRKWATDIGMVEKTWTPTVAEFMKKCIDEDPESVLEMFDSSVVEDYAGTELDMMTEERFKEDWSSYVDEDDIVEYASQHLNMVDEDEFADEWSEHVAEEDIKDYVSNNFDIDDIFDDESITEYARNTLEMMDEEEAIEFAKGKLSE